MSTTQPNPRAPQCHELDSILVQLDRVRDSLSKLYGSVVSSPCSPTSPARQDITLFNDSSDLSIPNPTVHAAYLTLKSLRKLRKSVNKRAETIDAALVSYEANSDSVFPQSAHERTDIHASEDDDEDDDDDDIAEQGKQTAGPGSTDAAGASSASQPTAQARQASGSGKLASTALYQSLAYQRGIRINNETSSSSLPTWRDTSRTIKPFIYSRVDAPESIQDIASLKSVASSVFGINISTTNSLSTEDQHPSVVLATLPGILQAWIYMHWESSNRPTVVRVTCLGSGEDKRPYALQSDFAAMQRISMAINEALIKDITTPPSRENEQDGDIAMVDNQDRWWSVEFVLGLVSAYKELGEVPCRISGEYVVLQQGAWVPPVWRVWTVPKNGNHTEGRWEASSQSPYYAM